MAGRVHNFKVVLLGDGCVGKTSIIVRYVEDNFNNKHITTVQAAYLNKKITFDDKRINLSIWDTAGQEQFHALGPLYYRGSNGAILVYDITAEGSFGKVKSWVKELRKMLGSDVRLVICGNKIDLERDRHVHFDDVEEYANRVGATHFQTSAKDNRGIDEMFLALVEQMLEDAEIGANDEFDGIRIGGDRGILRVQNDEDLEEDERKIKKHCCQSS